MSSNVIDLFSAFAVDTSKEQEGTLTQLPGAGDTLFRVCREGNKAYAKMLQRLVKANRAVLDSRGDAADKKSDEILIEVISSTILTGWEGKVRFQGKDLEYSKDNAKLLLAHKEFRNIVIKVSADAETFKMVTDEEDAKN